VADPVHEHDPRFLAWAARTGAVDAVTVARLRSELDQAEGGGGARHHPGLRQPEADELAEHLADLGRGDEVAGRAERVAGDVVAVARVSQAERHVVGDADRPGGADAGADDVGEPAHAARLRASQRKASPISGIGSERSWPMVSPPQPQSTT